jgi:5-methylcytosine-specific restriction protein A
MSTFLLTWNPAVWNGEITNPSDWTCGNSQRIQAGDRLFLLRQGTEPRGIVASGRSLTDVFEDDEGIRRVRMELDTLLDAECEDILPRDRLSALNGGLPKTMNWDVRISGTRIPEAVAERLEAAWRGFLSGRLPPADEVRQASALREGAVRQITVNAYERNSEARRRCIEHHGHACAVCGMAFGAVYGPLAEGFIHVHHLAPLSDIGEEYAVDPIADLRPVCPNCHAVLHLGGQCRSIPEVRRILEQQRHD